MVAILLPVPGRGRLIYNVALNGAWGKHYSGVQECPIASASKHIAGASLCQKLLEPVNILDTLSDDAIDNFGLGNLATGATP